MTQAAALLSDLPETVTKTHSYRSWSVRPSVCLLTQGPGHLCCWWEGVGGQEAGWRSEDPEESQAGWGGVSVGISRGGGTREQRS